MLQCQTELGAGLARLAAPGRLGMGAAEIAGVAVGCEHEPDLHAAAVRVVDEFAEEIFRRVAREAVPQGRIAPRRIGEGVAVHERPEAVQAVRPHPGDEFLPLRQGPAGERVGFPSGDDRIIAATEKNIITRLVLRFHGRGVPHDEVIAARDPVAVVRG